jgi:iron complex outermembrane recepter protein
MSKRNCRALILALGASVSWMALAASAHAQDVETEVGEVIVTATRRAENIQDVPMSVSAVTGEQLEKFQVQDFDQIQDVTAGLTLERQDRSVTTTLRGITFDPNAGSGPSVDTYINEIPIDPNYAFTSIFDVGQVEVLRGPQGTLRGRPAPTGAITLTTRRPNLSEYGGTVGASYTDRDSLNIEAAVNVPIIRDVLAVRLAAVYDDNTDNDVYNIVNNESSRRTTRGYRGTVTWQATDNLNFNLSHTTVRDRARIYSAVAGVGGGYTELNVPASPGVAGYNFYNVNPGHGPITASQRLSVSEGATIRPIDVDISTFNATYDFEGHRLYYTYGRVEVQNFEFAETDQTNNLPNYVSIKPTQTTDNSYSHELRLESTGERKIDYVLGLWYDARKSSTPFSTSPSPQIGFYDPNADVTPGSVPNTAYRLDVDGLATSDGTNAAIFGNVVFHLPARTHLSVGGRYFEDTGNSNFFLDIFGRQFAGPFGCPTDTYPGYCDIPNYFERHDHVANLTSDRGFVYATSLRHEFTDDIMGYISYGTSIRGGGSVVGIQTNDPDLLFFGDEKSQSSEIGLKTSWYDGRVKWNVAAFQQDFDDYIGRTQFTIPYRDPDFSSTSLQRNGGFTFNGDAVAKGMEMELSVQATDNLSFRVNWATADAHFENALAPCVDLNNDGIPDPEGTFVPDDYVPTGGQTLERCVTNGNVSARPTPNWTINAQSEYRAPLTFIGQPGLEGYVRGLFNYRPAVEGETFSRKAVSNLSIYAGVVSETGWEFGAYVRGLLLDEYEEGVPGQVSVDQIDHNVQVGVPGLRLSSGYRGANYTLGKEIGASFRYRFGRG